MPTLFLSPSTQEGNPYISGGSEEQYMNAIADAMIPYLKASGIRVVRNDRNASAAQAIADSNTVRPQLHLAIHSNAAPDALSGQLRGIDIYYAQNSTLGKRAAEIFAQNLRQIYPLPDKIRTLTTTNIGEVTRTTAPAVFLELGYHDNVQDAAWITSNIEEIAQNLSQSVTQYFGLPLAQPFNETTGTIDITSGNMNIRSRPSLDAAVIARAPKGAQLKVLGEVGEWLTVNYVGTIGYAMARYIDY